MKRLGVWSTPGGIARPWDFRRSHRRSSTTDHTGAGTSRRDRCREIDSHCRAQELLRQGVLDAALISGLELNGTRDADTSGLRLQELGSLPLELAVAHRAGAGKNRQPPPIKGGPVPHRGLAPGLHRALLRRGLRLRTIGNSCGTPEQWLERLADGDLALPIDPAACAHCRWLLSCAARYGCCCPAPKVSPPCSRARWST